MKVAIHSLRGTLYQGSAEKVMCYTPQGQITVLDHHIPLVSSLVGPAVHIITGHDGEKHTIPLASGVLEVRPGSHVVILTH